MMRLRLAALVRSAARQPDEERGRSVTAFGGRAPKRGHAAAEFTPSL